MITSQQQTTTGFRNEGTYHYRLLAMPDGEMAEKLRGEKRDFQREYNQGKTGPETPAVMITEFIARDEMEETIIRWLQRITGEQKSFGITLNNFSGCPDHTVFLRIQDHSPFHELAVQLLPIDEYVQSYNCPPVRFARQPHLPIAENLPGSLYQAAIGDYSRRDFHGSFEVRELMLVRMGGGDSQEDRRAVLRLQPGAEVN